MLNNSTRTHAQRALLAQQIVSMVFMWCEFVGVSELLQRHQTQKRNNSHWNCFVCVLSVYMWVIWVISSEKKAFTFNDYWVTRCGSESADLLTVNEYISRAQTYKQSSKYTCILCSINGSHTTIVYTHIFYKHADFITMKITLQFNSI